MPRFVRLAPLMWLLVAGCAGRAPVDVFLPTYGPMNGGPLALVRGTLLEENGCLWIQSTDARWLMLWPPGSTVIGDASQRVVLADNGGVTVGSEIEAGGGEYGAGHYDFVVELIGRPVPEECQASGTYWLGHDIRSLEP